MKHYVYILQCADGSLYTGITRDLRRRIERHNRGSGARYTRGRTPVKLVYHEEVVDIRSALKRERYLRKLPRAKKMELIHNFRNK